MKKLINFFKDEEGATAVEYGIMVGVIALGILLSVQGLRDALIDTFDAVTAVIPN